MYIQIVKQDLLKIRLVTAVALIVTQDRTWSWGVAGRCCQHVTEGVVSIESMPRLDVNLL